MLIVKYGLSVAAVGILTVFVALVILIGLIKVMEMVINGASKKKAAPAPAPAAPAPAPVVEETVAGEEDEGELIAVIAAAVAAAMEAAGEEPTGFVVRSVRRVNNAPAWNRAGREEQVYSRL